MTLVQHSIVNKRRRSFAFFRVTKHTLRRLVYSPDFLKQVKRK